MVDLNKLSPSALKAAMNGGVDSRGKCGSATEHTLYVDAIPSEVNKQRWRMCSCGCRKKSRYALYANGVALGSGCQFLMMRWLRESSQSKGEASQ